jgi:2-iminobutanoate/2-iminopropanoate deaminase
MPKQVLFRDEKGRSFARAVRAGQFLYIGGMTGQWDLTTFEHDLKSVGDVEYQTRRIYDHVATVLQKCGLTLDDLVSSTCYLRSMKDLETMMRVRREYVGDDLVSTCVAAADFVGTADIEITFIAMYPDGK